MSIIENVQSVLTQPEMLRDYAKWTAAKILLRRPPERNLRADVSLGQWDSFSEYWSFRQMVPLQERNFIERCMKNNNALALDIGANVGVFTCLLASPRSFVHAFEPIPETFCRMKQNLRRNGLLGRAQINCVAVGEKQGVVTFQIDDRDSATNRMKNPNDQSGGGRSYAQLVSTVSLDDYCDSQQIGVIDFVKLDVEGMEPMVLRGAAGLLKARRIKAFLIEICPVNLKSVGNTPVELFEEFLRAAYLPYKIESNGDIGKRLTLADIEATALDNVALLPDA